MGRWKSRSVCRVSPEASRGRFRVVVAVAVLAAGIVVIGPTPPAEATCGDVEFSKSYVYEVINGFNMALASQKQGVGCYDGNVRQSSASTTHRGRWRSDAEVWYWSSVGPKFLLAGTHSPVVVLIAGPITVGRWLKIGTYATGTGIWWF